MSSPEVLKQIPLGNSGMEVSSVGYGTYHLVDKLDEFDAVQSMGRAFDRGITLFDTSDNYGTEGLIGIAVRAGALIRDEVVIATKTGLGTSAIQQMRWNSEGKRQDTSPERIREQVDKSLFILGDEVGVIDLYQLHVYDPTVPALEQAGVMNELIQAGKIRAWGVSNYPADALTELFVACNENWLERPVSSQPFLNIVEGLGEDSELAHAEGMTLLAHSPLLKGMLVDDVVNRLSAQLAVELKDLDEADRPGHELLRQGFEGLTRLQAYGQERGLTLAQLAVSWVTSHPSTVSLSACTNDSYLSDAIEGANHKLDLYDEELVDIRHTFDELPFVNMSIQLMRQMKYYYH